MTGKAPGAEAGSLRRYTERIPELVSSSQGLGAGALGPEPEQQGGCLPLISCLLPPNASPSRPALAGKLYCLITQ